MAELSNDSIDDNLSDNTNDNIIDNVSDDISDNKGDNKDDAINDCDEREAVRRQFYKNRIKKDNIRLEIDSTPQEERRRILLEYQKKHRDEAINAVRGILQEYTKSEDEGYLEEEEEEEEEEDEEDEEEHSSWYHRILQKFKISRMMLSEWMRDVPQDFTENWVMVPCPTGNRVRLISGRGETRAYSRKGVLHGVFPSALPGGNRDSAAHSSAAVDCIWIKSRKLYYILDVLYWRQLSVTNCEAEFRLFWIKNKFLETPEFKERDTDKNRYPILTLQNIDCNSDLSSALTNLDDELHPLDGLLFYHRQALYTFGHTPLVTWLKPFMLPEVLGIFVPSSFNKKPDDYINFEHYMEKVKIKKNRDTSEVVADSMEIEVIA